jgi:hypothetical protein
MGKIDELVLNALADKIFNPERVKTILTDMKNQIKSAQESQEEGLKKLTKELGMKSRSPPSGFMKRLRKAICRWIRHCRNAPTSCRQDGKNY